MSVWERRSAAFGFLTKVGQGLKAVLPLVSALQQCQAALERASLLSFTYAPAGELARTTSVDELLHRIETINGKQDVPSTEALSGRISRPKPKLTEALDIYRRNYRP